MAPDAVAGRMRQSEEDVGPLLGLLGLVGFVIGVISLIVPLRRFGIHTRKRGLMVTVAGFVILMIGAGLTGSDDEGEPDLQAGTGNADPNTATTQESESTSSTDTDTAVDEPSGPTVAFEILEVDDLSFGSTTRWSARVLIPEGADASDLRSVAKVIQSDFRDNRGGYDALNVFFYHFAELSNGIYTLGNWEDAPFGDWARADESASDYSNFEPSEDLFDKNWALLPTAEQAEIQALYDEVFEELDTDPIDLPSDDEVFEVVAERAGVSVDFVQDALDAIFLWTFDQR